MSELEDLHAQATELEESLAETAVEIDRLREEPKDDPTVLAKRETTLAEEHARKVRALEREIAGAEKDLAAVRSELEDARMEVERQKLAAEKPSHPEGRTIGYALFAIGLLFLMYTCANIVVR